MEPYIVMIATRIAMEAVSLVAIAFVVRLGWELGGALCRRLTR